MLCTSVELGDDASTGTAGCVCLETLECALLGLDCCDVSRFGEVGWEKVLLAATPFVLVLAFFAAFVGWPSFHEVESPVAAALPAATLVHAALSGDYVSLAATLLCAALSDGRVLFGVFARRWLPQLAMPPCWFAATEGGINLALRVVCPRCCDAGLGALRGVRVFFLAWVELRLLGRTFGSKCCPRWCSLHRVRRNGCPEVQAKNLRASTRWVQIGSY